MNKLKINFNTSEILFLIGIIMMLLAIVNYVFFSQDWVGVCMFAIGSISALASFFVKN